MNERGTSWRWLAFVAWSVCAACGTSEQEGEADSGAQSEETPSTARDSGSSSDSGSEETPRDASSLPDAQPSAERDAAGTDASAAESDAGSHVASEPAPACAIAMGRAYEPLETRCDGLDNDCDGLVDFLVAVIQNACEEEGACQPGFAACRDGSRVCLAPGPAPEVIDGEDNDCDGRVDDAAPVAAEPRVLLLRPSYLMMDAAGELDNQVSFLEQWGVPFDVAEPLDDLDAQLAQLPGHALAVFPGYLVPEVLNAQRLSSLREFVEAGGVLIVTKPVFQSGDPLGGLLGFDRSQRRVDLEELRFEGRATATRLFDSPEEQRIPLIGAPGSPAPEAYLLLEPVAGASVLATGVIGGESIGALVMRRSLGQGAVYTLGHNLHHFTHARCYLNCFEPSGDLAGLFLREALREATRGHLVLVHTVPGAEDSVVLMTHDVDAWDAYHADPAWGEPGVLQVADLERARGARGSFMITTDYIAPYYAPEVIGALCEREMCPVGVHSVTHGDIRALPVGDCTETFADYPETRSLCGEVRVPIELVEQESGQRPVAWRSPFLYVPEQLYDVLESEGIGIDSSLAVGDLKFNLPISLARTGVFQHRFHKRNLYTATITLEDGIGGIVNGVSMRMEMSEANASRFEHIWLNTALRNADNSAYTVALLHPSYGLGVPEDNLVHKLGVIDAFLKGSASRGLRIDLTLGDVLEFWRAREGTRVAASFSAAGRYSGTIRIGSHALRDLTLEFGDRIGEFSCASCGPTAIADKRVVLRDTLAADSLHEFEAITSAP